MDSELSSLLAVLVAIAASAAFLAHRQRRARLLIHSDGALPSRPRQLHELPCPRSTLPLLGNTLDMAVHQRERLYDWFFEQCELHKGPWRLHTVGRPRAIVVASPELFEDVLKTQFELFPRGENECDIFRGYFGAGIFTLNGAAWHRQRAATSRLFSLPAMKTVMNDAVAEKLKVLCRVLDGYAARGERFSLKSVLTHFAADVFSRMALGVDRNSLENTLQPGYHDDFIDSSRTISYALQLRFHQPMWLWKLQRALGLGIEKRFKKSIAHNDFLLFNIINKSIVMKSLSKVAARKAVATETTTTKAAAAKPETSARAPAKDLVSIFLEQNALTESVAVDAQVIRDTVVNFMSPGTDTTSHCMSFFVVMLNRYPRVLEKIREELWSELPQLFRPGDYGAEPDTVVSVEALSKLTYLEAAVRESLRLNPQYPITDREAIADTVLCDGTFVPKGTRVVMAFYAAMRRRADWGDDALRFRPERWIDPATGGLLAVSPFKFSAFFAGPRKCLGMHFALVEVKMTMAVLLARYDIRTMENPWDLTYQVGLAASVKGPVEVAATRLKDGGRATAPALSARSA